MTRIKIHISNVKLPFYPSCEVKCRLQNRVSTPSAFPGLSCGLSFGFSLQSEAGPRMIMGFTFLWPTFGFLYCLPRWLVIPAVMTQSCWTPLWAGRLFLFSVAYHRHCFVFTHGLLCLFGFSLWASTARLLILLGFLGLFANSTLPWALLLTSLGFPGSITLSLSLGFMSLP